MNENDIRKYAGLMKELGLTGLEIRDDAMSVRLECGGTLSAPAALPVPAALPAQGPDPGVGAAPYDSVRSPLVGVYYASPAENAEPYVRVGDRVRAGQTLCIVEAMKLMNEIQAERDGVVSEILAANGQVVEYGTELFRLEIG